MVNKNELPMGTVTILMATYNGDKYIRPQLDSLLRQTYADWVLYIHDDGSTDDTRDILAEYQAKESRINVVTGEGKTLGTCGNFSLLLDQVAVSDYIMFCDQDDVWLPDKIEITLRAMQKAINQFGNDTPLLIHTDLQVVDTELKLIAASHQAYAKLGHITTGQLGRLLAQPYVFGCAMMINKSLFNASRPISPAAEMHDCWIALVAAAVGRVIFIPRATILYRQHVNNVSGGVSGSRLKNRLQRLFSGWSEIDRIVTLRLQQGFALTYRLQGKCAPEVQVMLADYHCRACQGGWPAVWGAVKYGVARQGKIRTLIFYWSLFKKKRLNLDVLNSEGVS